MDTVSDQKLDRIHLLRSKTTGRWWQRDKAPCLSISLASVVTLSFVEKLGDYMPNPDEWELVTFTEKR